MNVLVITPIYPSDFSAPNATPLVHYFTRKWVEQGHNVKVVHLCCKYPSFFYWIGKHFNNILSSKLGIAIANKSPWEYNEINEGVNIEHILLKKYIPHGRYSKTAVLYTLSFIESMLREFIPDIIVGHWANPTLEILNMIKRKYDIPCCLVLHETALQINHYYKQETKKLLDGIDILGYRSKILKEDIEKHYGIHRSFMAYSGVPESFLETAKNEPQRSFCVIKKFTFIGALIKRKYPTEILFALSSAYKNEEYSITYIGSGNEANVISKFTKIHNIENRVTLTGRIPRDNIMEYLKKTDVFIMISKREVYGLVYLEAMAFGCIPIASRNEGFDGIIVDGYNGFLCEAGNVEELTSILKKIKNLSNENLSRISQNAKLTALKFGDSNVAKQYLENVISIKQK